jgi:hypothetical protein
MLLSVLVSTVLLFIVNSLDCSVLICNGTGCDAHFFCCLYTNNMEIIIDVEK